MLLLLLDINLGDMLYTNRSLIQRTENVLEKEAENKVSLLTMMWVWYLIKDKEKKNWAGRVLDCGLDLGKVTHWKSPTSCQNYPQFVLSSCSVIGWEHSSRIIVLTQKRWWIRKSSNCSPSADYFSGAFPCYRKKQANFSILERKEKV